VCMQYTSGLCFPQRWVVVASGNAAVVELRRARRPVFQRRLLRCAAGDPLLAPQRRGQPDTARGEMDELHDAHLGNNTSP
jgi:hypothetical protein